MKKYTILMNKTLNGLMVDVDVFIETHAPVVCHYAPAGGPFQADGFWQQALCLIPD